MKIYLSGWDINKPLTRKDCAQILKIGRKAKKQRVVGGALRKCFARDIWYPVRPGPAMVLCSVSYRLLTEH